MKRTKAVPPKMKRTKVCLHKSRAGRPKSAVISYRREYNRIAETFGRHAGGTTAQLADVFNIHHVTLKTWRDEHPSFNRAVQRGRDAWDNDEIEKSMAQRAKGFKQNEKKYKSILLKDEDGNPLTDEDGNLTGETKLILTEMTVKEVGGDVSAGKFWLERRDAARWQLKEKAVDESQENNYDAILSRLADGLPD